MDGRCVNSQWHQRMSGWYVWTWSKPQRQEGAKGPFESFSSRVTLKCHSGRFPHPHCWIRHYSGFVLDGHFHYKGRNRTREEFWWSRCHRRGILGLLVHHSWWDYILGMENSCLACTSHKSILQVDKVERERRRGGWMIKLNVVWVSMLSGIEGSLCWTDREEARGKFCGEINFKPSILSDYVYFQSEFCNHSAPTPIQVFHFMLICEKTPLICTQLLPHHKAITIV